MFFTPNIFNKKLTKSFNINEKNLITSGKLNLENSSTDFNNILKKDFIESNTFSLFEGKNVIDYSKKFIYFSDFNYFDFLSYILNSKEDTLDFNKCFQFTFIGGIPRREILNFNIFLKSYIKSFGLKPIIFSSRDHNFWKALYLGDSGFKLQSFFLSRNPSNIQLKHYNYKGTFNFLSSILEQKIGKRFTTTLPTNSLTNRLGSISFYLTPSLYSLSFYESLDINLKDKKISKLIHLNKLNYSFMNISNLIGLDVDKKFNVDKKISFSSYMVKKLNTNKNTNKVYLFNVSTEYEQSLIFKDIFGKQLISKKNITPLNKSSKSDLSFINSYTDIIFKNQLDSNSILEKNLIRNNFSNNFLELKNRFYSFLSENCFSYKGVSKINSIFKYQKFILNLNNTPYFSYDICNLEGSLKYSKTMFQLNSVLKLNKNF